MLFDIVQLVEFAINDSVSPLSHRPPGDRLHTLLRRQVLGPPPPTAPDPAGSGEAAAYLIRRVCRSVGAFAGAAGAAGPYKETCRSRLATRVSSSRSTLPYRRARYYHRTGWALPNPSPRAHCAKHGQARHTCDVEYLSRVQRRAPGPLPPTTRQPW